RFPGASERIARSAAHAAESATLNDELGAIDLDAADTGDGLDVSVLRGLGAARAKNALRALCRRADAPAPASALLEELWRQLRRAREDALLRVDLRPWSFLRYRGRLFLERAAAAAPDFHARWGGEA